MKKLLAVSVIMAFVAPLVIVQAEAGSKYRSKYKGNTHTKTYRSTSKKKRTKVLGYSRQVGGYSFDYYDTLSPVPLPSRNFGPFDSGLFFDPNISSISSPSNNSPYLY